ncbi:hypothetical protein FQR65_LT00927 [Abscondita terminalis]|nr:hypothetical protein FQR65_LT00927 [Abscondita terminalis]
MLHIYDKQNLVFIILFVCIIKKTIGKIDDGYYWRDYDGVIPRDALAGGLDENGEPIYIGQVLYYDKLLPAKIYPYDKNAYYTWGTEYSTRENVKILCTPYPEKLRWVDTKKDELHLLINTHLVKGGFEPVYDIYIGRGFHKMQTLVGRIRAGNAPHLNIGLYVSVPSKEVIVPSFQVLTYDPNYYEPVSNRTCSRNILLKT